jgi:Tol biopolymer transport system component
MKNKNKFGLLISLMVTIILIIGCTHNNNGTNNGNDPKEYRVKSITTIIEYGKSLDWSHSRNLILSATKRIDGYYDVFVMKPDGTDKKYLTHNKSACPQKHNGNPVWHPSKDYIVFTAEKEGTPDEDDKWAIPGEGFNCDLWAMTTDEENFYPLTAYPLAKPVIGVIHPQFSHDGKKLFWAERINFGNSFGGGWILKTADFNIYSDGPYLENIETFLPGEWNCFYESHDFSKDDKKILFSGNLKYNQTPVGLDIYEMNLETNKLIRLTESDNDWDEHAHYSPDAKKIAWMSSTGFDIEWGDIKGDGWKKYLITELWLMNSDGSDKQRITYFNEPGYPEYMGGRRVVVSDSSWSQDGKKIVVCVAYSSIENREQVAGVKTVMIEFE